MTDFLPPHAAAPALNEAQAASARKRRMPQDVQLRLDFDRGAQLRLLREARLPKAEGVSRAALAAVLRALDDFGRGRPCWPSLETLAAATQLSRRTAARAVQALAAASLLVIGKRSLGPDGGAVNEYRIVWTELALLCPVTDLAPGPSPPSASVNSVSSVVETAARAAGKNLTTESTEDAENSRKMDGEKTSERAADRRVTPEQTAGAGVPPCQAGVPPCQAGVPPWHPNRQEAPKNRHHQAAAWEAAEEFLRAECRIGTARTLAASAKSRGEGPEEFLAECRALWDVAQANASRWTHGAAAALAYRLAGGSWPVDPETLTTPQQAAQAVEWREAAERKRSAEALAWGRLRELQRELRDADAAEDALRSELPAELLALAGFS